MKGESSFDKFLREFLNKSVEFQTDTLDDAIKMMRLMVLDNIGYELLRIKEYGVSMILGLESLSRMVFTKPEIEKLVKKHDKIVKKISHDIIKHVGKDVLFDVGVIAECIHETYKLIMRTLEKLEKGSTFSLVLVPYALFLKQATFNVNRGVLFLAKDDTKEFKKGNNFFREEIYERYFTEISEDTTVECIVKIAHLTSLLINMAEGVATNIANYVHEKILEMGGKIVGEKPCD